MSRCKQRRILITLGEPAGIGPDIAIMAAQQAYAAQLIVVADPVLLTQRATYLGIPLQLTEWQSGLESKHQPGHLYFLPVNLPVESECGQLNQVNVSYVLQTLDVAIEHCLNDVFDAIVTGPVQKSIINDAGISFSGHTEYFAEKTQATLPVMMLASKNLRVALVTTHLPLNQVAAEITAPRLSQVLQILFDDLQQKFGIMQPHVIISGLNPHAGEGGHLGCEEVEIITPVVQAFRQRGYQITGPLPADTLFVSKHLASADAVLAMYHDQGLPVLKYSGFGNAINVTLGLPIIRTSVDHGTALELAGTGQADSTSMQLAIKTAIEMTSLKGQSRERL